MISPSDLPEQRDELLNLTARALVAVLDIVPWNEEQRGTHEHRAQRRAVRLLRQCRDILVGMELPEEDSEAPASGERKTA